MDKYLTRLPGNNKRSIENDRQFSSNIKNIENHPNKKNNLQMYIDLGQKSFSATKLCPVCNMFYVLDDTIDVKKHDNYCKSFEKGPALNSLRGYRQVDCGENYQILELTLLHEIGSDSITDLFQSIERDLGCSSELLQFKQNDSKTMYLYVTKLRIIGCIIAEKLSEKMNIIQINDSSETSVVLIPNQNTIPKVIRDNNIPLIGIRAIWVNNNCRRQGICTKLMDTVRRYFLYGDIVQMNRIAFSQPTRDGYLFASKYINSNSVLIYS